MKKVLLLVSLLLCIFLITGCKERINEYAYSESELRVLEDKYYGEISFSTIYSGVNCFTGQQTRKINT